ncbi:hypothetical protein Tco_0391248 [Tanacetum coccineum]
MRIEESLNVTFNESLPDPKSSSLVEDDRINEPIVQDLNRSQSLQTLGVKWRKGPIWKKGDDFGVDVFRFHTCLTDILGFLEKLEWWFEQDIDDEEEEDEESKGGSKV